MATAPYTLADLLAGQSRPALQARFLALLGQDSNPPPAPVNSNHGFPTADWVANPNGLEMAFVRMVRDGTYDLVASTLPTKIAGRFLGKAAEKGASDFLTYNAKRFYDVDRNAPTKTTFNLDVSSTPTASPYTFAVGDIWVQGYSGGRYVSTSGGILPPGGTLTVSFEAEFSGSTFNDNPSLVPPTLITAPAGVTVAGHVGDFTTPLHSGAGTGHIDFSRREPDVPPFPGLYVLRVDVSGDPGVARFSLSINSSDFFGIGPLFPSGDMGAVYGVIANPAAGAGTPASFVVNDTYTTSSPGGTGYVQGNDQEPDPSVVDRSRARWPSLSLNQTSDVFVLWTKQAYPSVSRVSARADPQAPGWVQIVAADAHGGIDATAATAIAAYINPKLGDVLSHVSVAGAASRMVTTAGTVTVTALTVQAIQQTIKAAWTAYLATVAIGGVVVLSELEQIIMDAGAVDVTGLQLVGLAANLPLVNNEVPIAAEITTELDWAYV